MLGHWLVARRRPVRKTLQFSSHKGCSVSLRVQRRSSSCTQLEPRGRTHCCVVLFTRTRDEARLKGEQPPDINAPHLQTRVPTGSARGCGCRLRRRATNNPRRLSQCPNNGSRLRDGEDGRKHQPLANRGRGDEHAVALRFTILDVSGTVSVLQVIPFQKTEGIFATSASIICRRPT